MTRQNPLSLAFALPFFSTLVYTATHGLSWYRFIPPSVETFSRLGQPFVAMLTDPARRAATHSGRAFTTAQFVTSAMQTLLVCLCRRNTNLERAVAKHMAWD
jgi:hypothetical protein